jgi:excinuclease ABC subunit C
MSTAAFDRKFGADFLVGVPNAPGIYRVFDASGALVYVGKAKSLRRRLSQYRRASRRKAHRKMRAIVALAARIEVETCATEHDARLMEARLIQTLRPRANVDGAYWFLYPFVGLARIESETRFCFTTHAEVAGGFELHGAYRASEVTWKAFSALMELLEYVGHRSRARGDSTKGFIVYRFRRLSSESLAEWTRFFSGESREALRSLTLALLENAGARAHATDVQVGLEALKAFWESEARPLFEARIRARFELYPVPQYDRDVLFVEARHLARAAG